MGEGLAAHVVSNAYGNGEGNTVTHYYDRGSKSKTKSTKGCISSKIASID